MRYCSISTFKLGSIDHDANILSPSSILAFLSYATLSSAASRSSHGSRSKPTTSIPILSFLKDEIHLPWILTRQMLQLIAMEARAQGIKLWQFCIDLVPPMADPSTDFVYIVGYKRRLKH